MDVKRLYSLVKNFFGYKCNMIGINSESTQVTCFLYDSFVLRCELESQHKMFGAGLEIANGIVLTDFLGKRCSLNNDEASIKESLQIIDDYCRLRLPDKFLDEYYKAYVLSQYEDCDL